MLLTKLVSISIQQNPNKLYSFENETSADVKQCRKRLIKLYQKKFNDEKNLELEELRSVRWRKIIEILRKIDEIRFFLVLQCVIWKTQWWISKKDQRTRKYLEKVNWKSKNYSIEILFHCFLTFREQNRLQQELNETINRETCEVKRTANDE